MKIVLSVVCAYLLFLLQKYIYKKIWKKNLGVTVSFVTPFGVEGQESSFTEVIENAKVFPVPILRVKFSFARGLKLIEGENVTRSDKFYKNDIFSVMPYMRITRTHKFLCEKRGLYSIDSVSVSSSDLLMSANFVDVRSNATQFMVYPSQADIMRLLPVFSKIMGERETKALLADPFSFVGIRDYERFDSVRDINWKVSAKTGDLKVNVHSATQTGEVRLVLNLEPDSDWVDNGIREEGIRIAATLAALFSAKGVTVSLQTNGRDVLTDAPANISGGCGPGHEKTIKETLARIDLEKNCVPFQDTVNHLLEENDDSNETVLITGAKSKTSISLYEQLAEQSGLHIIMLTRPGAPQPPVKIYGAVMTNWEVAY